MGIAVWPENALAVVVFGRLGRQWRRRLTLMGELYEGIPATAIKATLELMGVKRKKWPRLFAELNVMERAALPVLNG